MDVRIQKYIYELFRGFQKMLRTILICLNYPQIFSKSCEPAAHGADHEKFLLCTLRYRWYQTQITCFKSSVQAEN